MDGYVLFFYEKKSMEIRLLTGCKKSKDFLYHSLATWGRRSAQMRSAAFCQSDCLRTRTRTRAFLSTCLYEVLPSLGAPGSPAMPVLLSAADRKEAPLLKPVKQKMRKRTSFGLCQPRDRNTAERKSQKSLDKAYVGRVLGHFDL